VHQDLHPPQEDQDLHLPAQGGKDYPDNNNQKISTTIVNHNLLSFQSEHFIN
jgi:hypothetical protein